jgi:predicted PurR-regulated permease PerM
MGYIAVFLSAGCAGLIFALLYWPLETWLMRQRFPKRVLAGRMIAAFLFFLVVWLAFPLKEAL